jgi:hypothetical protein
LVALGLQLVEAMFLFLFGFVLYLLCLFELTVFGLKVPIEALNLVFELRSALVPLGFSPLQFIRLLFLPFSPLSLQHPQLLLNSLNSLLFRLLVMRKLKPRNSLSWRGIKSDNTWLYLIPLRTHKRLLLTHGIRP